MRALLFCLMLSLAAACGAETTPSAPQSRTDSISLENAWASPTPGGVEVSAGYVTIANAGVTEDRLLSAASPRAQRVELHEMSMDGGVMRMRAIDGGLVIPAGGGATLAPGGQHLMFFGVTQPFAEGETIPVTLTFANAGAMSVELEVRRGAPAHAH